VASAPAQCVVGHVDDGNASGYLGTCDVPVCVLSEIGGAADSAIHLGLHRVRIIRTALRRGNDRFGPHGPTSSAAFEHREYVLDLIRPNIGRIRRNNSCGVAGAPAFPITSVGAARVAASLRGTFVVHESRPSL
jgi:hypothetical protein